MLKLTKDQLAGCKPGQLGETVAALNKRLAKENVIPDLPEFAKSAVIELYMQCGWEIYDYGDSLEFVNRYDGARFPDPEQAYQAAENALCDVDVK